MAIKTAEIPVSYPYLSVQYIYIVEIFTWDYPPPPPLFGNICQLRGNFVHFGGNSQHR